MEIAEAEGLATDQFHFGVKAFGDPVIAGEAPHRGDLVLPTGEGFAERDQLRQSGLPQLVDGVQQAGRQEFALVAGAVLFEQQVAEPLFESIDRRQDGPACEVIGEAVLLVGREVVAMAAHEAEQAAVFGAGGIDLAPAGEEVVVDEADDVEAVGDDAGVGEVFADQGAVGAGQVHANDLDGFTAAEALQIAFQSGFRAAEHDIVDLVVFEVAEGGRVAVTAAEEVLVDAEQSRALGRVPFAVLTLEAAAEVAIDGGGADLLASRQDAAIHAVQVLLVDLALEAFAGPEVRRNARQPLAELTLPARTGLMADHF